jgi:hypothetical protein
MVLLGNFQRDFEKQKKQKNNIDHEPFVSAISPSANIILSDFSQFLAHCHYFYYDNEPTSNGMKKDTIFPTHISHTNHFFETTTSYEHAKREKKACFHDSYFC